MGVTSAPVEAQMGMMALVDLIVHPGDVADIDDAGRVRRDQEAKNVVGCSLDELIGFYGIFVLRAVRAPVRAGAPVPWRSTEAPPA